MKTIKSWPVWAKIAMALVIVIGLLFGGSVVTNALSADDDAPTGTMAEPADESDLIEIAGVTGPTAPAQAAGVDYEGVCETFATDGFSLEGFQQLAIINEANVITHGTQVRGDAEEAAQAYLEAIVDDIDKLGLAELVYQAAGIHPSRILDSGTEDIDVNAQLRLLLADEALQQDVCEQILLEANLALETGELTRVNREEQATVNILVHDLDNDMLPVWVCQKPVSENGIDVLSYAQFIDGESGNAPEQVLYSITQRAYITLGACPDSEGARQFDDTYTIALDDCAANEVRNDDEECEVYEAEPVVCEDGEVKVEVELDAERVVIETCVPEAIVVCEDGEVEVVDADGVVTGCEPNAETPCSDEQLEVIDDDGSVVCEDPSEDTSGDDGDEGEEPSTDTTCTSNCDEAPAPTEPQPCTATNTCPPTPTTPTTPGPEVPGTPTCPSGTDRAGQLVNGQPCDYPPPPPPTCPSGTDRAGQLVNGQPCDYPPPPPPTCPSGTDRAGQLVNGQPCDYPPPPPPTCPSGTDRAGQLVNGQPCDYPPPPPPTCPSGTDRAGQLVNGQPCDYPPPPPPTCPSGTDRAGQLVNGQPCDYPPPVCEWGVGPNGGCKTPPPPGDGLD